MGHRKGVVTNLRQDIEMSRKSPALMKKRKSQCIAVALLFCPLVIFYTNIHSTTLKNELVSSELVHLVQYLELSAAPYVLHNSRYITN